MIFSSRVDDASVSEAGVRFWLKRSKPSCALISVFVSFAALTIGTLKLDDPKYAGRDEISQKAVACGDSNRKI
jgi:hypothetical protein